MGLVARKLEAAGIPTVTLNMIWVFQRLLGMPRVAAIEHPFGRPYGDVGDALYFILQGEVEIRLPTRIYHYKRLAKLGAGSFFGEDAFLDPAPHTATAVVTEDAELLVLDRQGIESLAEKRQREAGWAVLYELGGSIARQLRWSQSELRRLVAEATLAAGGSRDVALDTLKAGLDIARLQSAQGFVDRIEASLAHHFGEPRPPNRGANVFRAAG